MTSFYYLYKYGTCTSTGKSLLANGGSFLSNNFLGAYLNYGRFDTTNSMDFLTDNVQDPSATTHTFNDFYNQYKTVAGSDFMSYISKYSNTSDMALGDMVNFSNISDTFTNNLVADVNTFYFRNTMDGEAFRYTHDGTAEALKDVSGTSAGVDFADLEAAYHNYYDYKVAQLTPNSVPVTLNAQAVRLSALGLDYTSILKAAQGNVTVAKSIYQNIVNQLVDEATAIKGSTLSQESIIELEKELEDKQRGLKAIDDALYGFVDDSKTVQVAHDMYTLTNNLSAASFSAGISAINTASAGKGITGTTNATNLLNDLGSITVQDSDGVHTLSTFTAALKDKIASWVSNKIDNSSDTVFGASVVATSAVSAIIGLEATSTNAEGFIDALDSNDLTTIAAQTSLANLTAWLTSYNSKSVTVNGTTTTYTLAPGEITDVANVLWVGNADAGFTDKNSVTTWVAANYSSLGGSDQINMTNYLWRKHVIKTQEDNYVNDLTNAIAAQLTNKVPVKSTQYTTEQSPGITTRYNDNNYSGGNGSIYLDDTSDLTSLIIEIIRNVDAHGTYKWEKSNHDRRTRSVTQTIPAAEVYKVLHTIGVEIKDSSGAVVKTGLDASLNPARLENDNGDTSRTTIWGENGCENGDSQNTAYGRYALDSQELMYAWLASNPSALVNLGEGKFSFDYKGSDNVTRTYYIDTRAEADLDATSSHVVPSGDHIVGAVADKILGVVAATPNMADRTQVPMHVASVLYACYAAGKKGGGEGELGIRHIKPVDISKPALSQNAVMKLNTDTNSIVYQLADSLLQTKDITPLSGTTVSDQDKAEFAVYLSEVTAGIMEQYWIENLNNPNAEPIDVYFNREFRAYLNPKATQGPVNFNFINSSGDLRKFTLLFSEDPAATTIIDRIMEKQSWAQMLTKMEDRSRAELALFEESAAMDVAVNINTKEFQYRMVLLAALEQETAANTQLGTIDFSKVTKNLVTQGPGKEQNPWWSKYFPWFKGYYGNLPNGATPDQMFDENGNLTLRYSGTGNIVDPYLVKINGTDYVMGVDKNQDGNINNAQEILGIEDTIETTFASLVALDTNKDGYVSQEELKAQNIIFKAVNTDSKLNGSTMSTDLIKGINLSSLEKGDGTNNVYGLFDVDLANGKKAAAVQTFESQSYFNNLFSDYADLSFLSKTKSNSTASTSAVSTNAVANASVVKSEAGEASKNTSVARGYNFFSYLAKADETKTEEPVQTLVKIEEAKTVAYNNKEVTLDKLIDELCWKSGIELLSGKQRYDILGSVDMTQDADMIVRKVQEKLNKIHTEFSA